jgi:hypothetical protein
MGKHFVSKHLINHRCRFCGMFQLRWFKTQILPLMLCFNLQYLAALWMQDGSVMAMQSRFVENSIALAI